MPKKYHRRRHLKGGFLDSLGQTFSNWGNSISQTASSAWNKTKKATGMDNTSYAPSTSSTYTPSYTSSTAVPSSPSLPAAPAAPAAPAPPSSYSYGGKRGRTTKRVRKVKKGGYRDNVSLTNLASRAGPFAGQTAKAHNWVGGKKRKTRGRR